MLVTFHSKASADFTMFGDVAMTLLKMMGHSGTVPSAVMAEDIPAALERLRFSLKQLADDEGDGAEGEEVSLSRRAQPLLDMLDAAREADTPVMWDQ